MTSHPLFPFAALVGLDEMQMALQLAAIDRRLSVLLRGDKGAGKSTGARGLGELLGDDRVGEAVPFVNLPIGATEDRLLGGLDLARTLEGEPALKPGLLAEAHGGVLYVDEINLLPDHLADALLDAAASGVHIVEREGFSKTQPADFVLVGSMNPEEGGLRPQLLDRFALVVDVEAPMTPADRRLVVQRRLAFERDPSAFVETWRARQAEFAASVRQARDTLAHVTIDEPLLDAISEQACAHGVRSLRADLAIVRASRALAALDGARTVTIDHVARVLPLALRHRAGRAPANNLPSESNNAPGSNASSPSRSSSEQSPPATSRPSVPPSSFAPRLRPQRLPRPSRNSRRARQGMRLLHQSTNRRHPMVATRRNSMPQLTPWLRRARCSLRVKFRCHASSRHCERSKPEM